MQNYGRYSDDQDTLSRTLQKKIVTYIRKNMNNILLETGMSIKDSIQLIHEISIDEYLNSYKNFAGDIDVTEECMEDDYFIDRWGSIVEQSVISNMECPVVVFNSQKFDKRYNKIVNGKILKNKPERDVRLRLSSISGSKYIGKLPIFLLWREYHNNGHYLVCYPKNIDKIYDIIKL